MTPLLSLVLLVLIAFLGSYIFKRLQITALWLKGVAYSGVLYVALGYLIGPDAAELVTKSVSGELNILFALVLGWAGFLIGIQTNVKGLKRFPRRYYLSGTLNFISVLVLLFVLIWALVQYLNISSVTLVDISLLSVVGAISSPVVLGILIRDYRLDGRLSYRLQFGAAFNNLLGVVVLEGVFLVSALFSVGISPERESVLRFVFPVLIVPLSVFIYSMIYEVMKTRQEKFLLFLSLLFLLVGMAYYFKQSILFISFLFGAGLANIKISSVKLYQTIQELEKPLYVLLLVFAGMNLRLYENLFVYGLLAGFFLIRIVVKVFSHGVLLGLLEKEDKFPLSIGLGGVGMGGLTLAVVLDYLLLGHAQTAQLFLFVVIVSLVVNDIIALQYLSKNLIRNRL